MTRSPVSVPLVLSIVPAAQTEVKNRCSGPNVCNATRAIASLTEDAGLNFSSTDWAATGLPSTVSANTPCKPKIGVKKEGCANPLLLGRFGPTEAGVPFEDAGVCGCVWFGFDGEAEGCCWICCPDTSTQPSTTNVRIFASLMNNPMIFN